MYRLSDRATVISPSCYLFSDNFLEFSEPGFEVVRLETRDRDSLQDNKMNKYSIVDGDGSDFFVETKGNVAIVKVKKVTETVESGINFHCPVKKCTRFNCLCVKAAVHRIRFHQKSSVFLVI